jgi:hypothetical protein
MQPEFKTYQLQVKKNAQTMANAFLSRGVNIVSGGTDNHLMLVDLISRKITGKDLDAALGRAYITVNKNAVPNDPQSPFVTSGIRVGTPATTTRGFKESEAKTVANWICDIIENMGNESVVEATRKKVMALCKAFPLYGDLASASKTARKSVQVRAAKKKAAVGRAAKAKPKRTTAKPVRRRPARKVPKARARPVRRPAGRKAARKRARR